MQQVFEIWPTMAEMARDLGLSPINVRHWKRRGIPPKHDLQIVQAARKRGASLSLESLARLRAASKSPH